MSERGYVPAVGREELTRLYDPLVALTMREGSWRPELVGRLGHLGPTDLPVVDVGAGTGTFALMIARTLPGARVIAIDGDPEVMGIAMAKPGADRVDFRLGLATELDLPDESAEAVIFSLVLHHLSAADKVRALEEARRVLRPEGGRLLIADFGRPSLPTTPGFLAIRLLDGLENTRAHMRGEILDLVRGCGFREATVFDRIATVWGSLELIEARSP